MNVGSALSYRAIPLQSVYCAAKYAVRGFTDALRSELMHDRSAVHLTMVHLPAMNTPQFDWALNKTRHRPQPVPPIFSPDVAARAILFAATHRRREVWVGASTVKAIVAGWFAPGLVDRYLASLSAEDRMILASYFLDGRTLAEVARMLGVHESTISRRVEKLTRSLRKKVLEGLGRRGMDRRQAQEVLDADVRDLTVDVRRSLAQETAPVPFSEKGVEARVPEGES